MRIPFSNFEYKFAREIEREKRARRIGPINITSNLGLVVVVVLAIGLKGCGDSGPVVGEVAVKVARGFTAVPPIVIDKDKWFSSDPDRFTVKENGNPTVLRRAPGNYKLLVDRDGSLTTACTFEVKQNRVVTITLRVLSRDVRCEIIQ
jgi:hypothetical protein